MNRILSKSKYLGFYKIVLLSIAIVICIGFCGCNTKENSNKIKVVTTIFPEYDWMRQVIGNLDNYELSLLIDNGTDLHSYQPTVADLALINDCDVFVYVGGESDEWVDEALGLSKKQDKIVINLLNVLTERALEEEFVEGMQGGEEGHHHAEDEDSEEHHHDEDEDSEGHHHGEDEEYDEHVWLSLKNAKVVVEEMSDALSNIDTENAEVLKSNSTDYISKLDELDKEYEKKISESGIDTLLFADRFPFRYLVNDYDLKYYAAFLGCSAETEASFETIVFLSKKLDELGLKKVFILENSDDAFAETVIDSSSSEDVQVVILDSLQSVNSKQIENGVTYLSIMEENVNYIGN